MLRCRQASLHNRLASLVATAALALATPAAAGSVASDGEIAPPRRELALMGTIPIYWGEHDGFGDLLSGEGQVHWARAALEQEYQLAPLDYLSPEALAGKDLLVLAQPRGLTADENVALDAWVRAGGRLLLFVDPQMTGESRYGLGDRRRPQDVALLSPILAHWGLELQFDPAQDPNGNLREFAGHALPVRLSGAFSLRENASSCALLAADLVAQCGLGRGFALLVADAALLDLADPAPEAAEALQALTGLAFGNLAGMSGMDAAGDQNIAEIQDDTSNFSDLASAIEEAASPP